MADRHADHDLLLIAALAAGDAQNDDLTRAETLVGTCVDCASVAADLQAISRAIAELPEPPRPRDFSLAPADAERLRPRGLRRLAAALGGPRSGFTRPLAGGLMAIGFAGLLAAALPGLPLFGASSQADRGLEFLASAAPGPDVAGQPMDPYATRVPSGTRAALGEVRGSAGQEASIAPAAGGPILTSGVEPDALKTSREAATGPSALVIGSVALVAIGAFLFLASLLRPGPRRS